MALFYLVLACDVTEWASLIALGASIPITLYDQYRSHHIQHANSTTIVTTSAIESIPSARTPLVTRGHIFTFLNLATFVRLSCEYVRYTGVSLRQDK